MPIYEYECKKCGLITEHYLKIGEDKPMNCHKCGGEAVKILSANGAVHTDGDVKWLESARQTLQPDGERPIETRGEFNRYLKKRGIICKG